MLKDHVLLEAYLYLLLKIIIIPQLTQKYPQPGTFHPCDKMSNLMRGAFILFIFNYGERR